MTLTVLALLVGAAAGLLTGGRPRHVAGHPLRATWLLAAGVVLLEAPGRLAPGSVGIPAAMAGYACLLTFAARNRMVIGMGIVAVGLVANSGVLGLNGGMPVRSEALVAAHMAGQDQLAAVDYGALHHAERPGELLAWLDDRIPVPELHQVLSFGDLVLALGVADVVAHFFHPRRRRAGPSALRWGIGRHMPTLRHIS